MRPKTAIQGLDPRTRFLVMAACFVALLIVWDVWYLAAIGLFIILYGYLVRGLGMVLRFWWIIAVIAAFTVVVWALYLTGETPLFWIVSKESLFYGVATALKLVLMILSGIFYFTGVTPDEMAAGFSRMGVPYTVAFSFSYAMRLFPLILADTREITRIQESRGLDLKSGSIFSRFKKYIPLLTPIFLTTIRSTNNLAMALESRGFGARPSRQWYLHLRLRAIDWIVLACSVLLVGAVVALRLLGHGGIEGAVRRW
jgi:energy-coupling factor transport system permease protein